MMVIQSGGIFRYLNLSVPAALKVNSVLGHQLLKGCHPSPLKSTAETHLKCCLLCKREMDILAAQQRVTYAIKEWECLLYEERLREVSQKRMPCRSNINAYMFLFACCKYEADYFSVVAKERTRDNDHKLI